VSVTSWQTAPHVDPSPVPLRQDSNPRFFRLPADWLPWHLLTPRSPLSADFARSNKMCKKERTVKGPVWSSECFVSRITQQMSSKFAIRSRNWKLFDKHNSDPYWFSINPAVLEQNSSWKAYSCWATDEIPCHLWNKTIHYSRVEAGPNTSTVALRVVGGDEKGTRCLGI
jgi:hypothetical protein